jgi:hypothetical protein
MVSKWQTQPHNKKLDDAESILILEEDRITGIKNLK